jgi:hypothetical protein
MERRVTWVMLGVLLAVFVCWIGHMPLAAATAAQGVENKPGVRSSAGSMTLKVFDPRGKVKAVRFDLAPRLKDLNGKTIGLLCDWLDGHEDDFANLKKELSARFKDLKFIEWRSEATVPLDQKARAEVLGPAKKADAVIGFTGL